MTKTVTLPIEWINDEHGDTLYIGSKMFGGVSSDKSGSYRVIRNFGNYSVTYAPTREAAMEALEAAVIAEVGGEGRTTKNVTLVVEWHRTIKTVPLTLEWHEERPGRVSVGPTFLGSIIPDKSGRYRVVPNFVTLMGRYYPTHEAAMAALEASGMPKWGARVK